MTISYAQQFEDVMLWRALKDVGKGAYIDIGANDPVIDSVSMLFYENGWRGMHVEPMPDCAAKLREARPDEDVLEVAVGSGVEELTLYSFEGTGLTTAVEEHARSHQENGREAELIKVPCLPLSEIFEQFNRRHIHWLKVDVEGMEKAVLESWGKHPARPWIVIVESTEPLSSEPAFEAWEGELTKRNYDFVYFDGLNRFYLHSHHSELEGAFLTPPNYFDRFVLSEHSPFSGFVAGKWNDARKTAERLEHKLEHLQAHHQSVDEARLHLERHVAAIESQLTASQDQLTNERISWTASLEDLQSKFDAKEAALEDLQSRFEAKTAAAEALGTNLQALSQQLALSEQRVASLQHELDNWRAEAFAYRDQSREIFNSASWKLSAPIRWAGSGARGAVELMKAMLRPVIDGSLKLARANPWIKRPILAAANLVPPVRSKIDHFVSIRAPERPPNSVIRTEAWKIAPDSRQVAEWNTLLNSGKSDRSTIN
ncbi:FkbM family methyltransferase [Hyphomonas sp. GM-8P]|uniref:FkbM family methyltransferase n=1 Tax=Hyphomonas sp. GM-8P TaxID=1280945 RepID=UPI000DBF84F9|nr:FkbM family methyltransferase [Hyphomonas sp. GM-8P]RAN37915.1 hypothetical protein HY26_04240 [Hyphomonas sp. GM-8P]